MNRETDNFDSRSTLSLPQSVTASYQGDDPSLAKIYCLILDRSSTPRARVIGHHYACPESLFWDVLRLLFLSSDNTEENYVRMQSQPTLYTRGENDVSFNQIQQFGIYEIVFMNEHINLSYEDIVVSYRSEQQMKARALQEFKAKVERTLAQTNHIELLHFSIFIQWRLHSMTQRVVGRLFLFLESTGLKGRLRS